MIGNGEKVRIWEDRWLPRPYSFRPVTAGRAADPTKRVAELIDKDSGVWKEQVLRASFLPCDVEIIFSLPLCQAWPEDKLIWHFSTNGKFSVKSTYQVERANLHVQRATLVNPVIIPFGGLFGD